MATHRIHPLVVEILDARISRSPKWWQWASLKYFWDEPLKEVVEFARQIYEEQEGNCHPQLVRVVRHTHECPPEIVVDFQIDCQLEFQRYAATLFAPLVNRISVEEYKYLTASCVNIQAIAYDTGRIDQGTEMIEQIQKRVIN